MDYFAFDINSDLILAIDGVKMRRGMITIEHGYDLFPKTLISRACIQAIKMRLLFQAERFSLLARCCWIQLILVFNIT